MIMTMRLIVWAGMDTHSDLWHDLIDDIERVQTMEPIDWSHLEERELDNLREGDERAGFDDEQDNAVVAVDALDLQ